MRVCGCVSICNHNPVKMAHHGEIFIKQYV